MERFYRPIAESVTIRVDADALAWPSAGDAVTRRRINQLLREAMEGMRQLA